MTLVAAAVCPHPPLLYPKVGAGEPVAARGPALAAVRDLIATGLDLLVVVGDGPLTRDYGPSDVGTFDGFGAGGTFALGGRAGGGKPVLPLSLTVGAWLLREVAWHGQTRGFGVAANVTADEAAAAGARLAGLADRVGLLVLGDGSACRSPKAPCAFDERAEPFDDAVETALATGDAAALLRIDAALARDLHAAGRASWQALAGAAQVIGPHVTNSSDVPPAETRSTFPEAHWDGYVTYSDAPYGVGYLVAVWKRGTR